MTKPTTSPVVQNSWPDESPLACIRQYTYRGHTMPTLTLRDLRDLICRYAPEHDPTLVYHCLILIVVSMQRIGMYRERHDIWFLKKEDDYRLTIPTVINVLARHPGPGSMAVFHLLSDNLTFHSNL